jgi:UDP-N-acetylmuramoylalanine--D-glutamate ligase
MEEFAERGGVRFINDSAATIPEAVREALKSLSEPVILIAGGTDKNLDFSVLEDVLGVPKELFLLDGTAAGKFCAAAARAGRTPRICVSLEQAVSGALAAASPGDIVLLSPGCASFGMFLNEFDRGKKFKETVRALTVKKPGR